MNEIAILILIMEIGARLDSLEVNDIPPDFSDFELTTLAQVFSEFRDTIDTLTERWGLPTEDKEN